MKDRVLKRGITDASRVISYVLCIALLISVMPYTSHAYEKEEHDSLMSKVLFRNYTNPETFNAKQKNVLQALEDASYLAIDQFNHGGQEELQHLRAFGVKNLPSGIEEIDFASNSYHRRYTHRGWDFVYEDDKAHWSVRKQILLSTVDKAFEKMSVSVEQKEAFCELLYYIHVIGDHHANKSDVTLYNRQDKMDIGGRADENDVIHELLTLMPKLFKDQIHTTKYIFLKERLVSLNQEFAAVVRQDGGIKDDESYSEYWKLTNDLFDNLTYYFPELLKGEQFFYNVFYK